MATTQIKRLYLNSKEFVPITLAEAVVVNTSGMDIVGDQGITTLDNVLRIALGITDDNADSIITLNNAVDTINKALSDKQDKLTPGAGITIEGGVISANASLSLYKIVKDLPNPTKECLNSIYLVRNTSLVSGNLYKEFVCYEYVVDSQTVYNWEELGTIQTDVDLSGYVTNAEYLKKIASIEKSITDINTILLNTITAQDVKTSEGASVVVDYNIPNNLYDSLIDS